MTRLKSDIYELTYVHKGAAKGNEAGITND
jgi:hypothetical protein